MFTVSVSGVQVHSICERNHLQHNFVHFNFRLSYAQSLFQSGLFDEASNITTEITATEMVNSKNMKEKVLLLQSAIRYSNEDYAGAQSILLQRQPSHHSTLNDEGCLLYQVRRSVNYSFLEIGNGFSFRRMCMRMH